MKTIIALATLVCLIACDDPEPDIAAQCIFTHDGKTHTFIAHTDGNAPVWHQGAGYVNCTRLDQ